jgi:hypothetical protein
MSNSVALKAAIIGYFTLIRQLFVSAWAGYLKCGDTDMGG